MRSDENMFTHITMQGDIQQFWGKKKKKSVYCDSYITLVINSPVCITTESHMYVLTKKILMSIWVAFTKSKTATTTVN